MTIRRKWIFAITIIAILVFPVVPVQRRDDGGTGEYLSLTWQLENCRILHRKAIQKVTFSTKDSIFSATACTMALILFLTIK